MMIEPIWFGSYYVYTNLSRPGWLEIHYQDFNERIYDVGAIPFDEIVQNLGRALEPLIHRRVTEQEIDMVVDALHGEERAIAHGTRWIRWRQSHA